MLKKGRKKLTVEAKIIQPDQPSEQKYKNICLYNSNSSPKSAKYTALCAFVQKGVIYAEYTGLQGIMRSTHFPLMLVVETEEPFFHGRFFEEWATLLLGFLADPNPVNETAGCFPSSRPMDSSARLLSKARGWGEGRSRRHPPWVGIGA